MKNDLFYIDTGSGPPVVLLHGNCETHHIWDEFIRKLSKSHRIIAPDLPGFGESSLPDDKFSLADIAQILHDLLKRLAIQPVMIGHSLGGYITLAYVKFYPGELKGFGMFHSSAYADSIEKKENRSKLIEFIEKNGVRPFINSFIPSLFFEKRREELNQIIQKLTDEALNVPARTVQEYARAMRDREENISLLQTFSKPVMMIIGENDNSVALEKSMDQSKMIQRPYILSLKETGHMGMLERPAETLHYIQNFLNVCQ
jgi:pimeloyl-ACP methyl ester carboxylesterase